MNEQHLRMSDAERAAASAELGEHYAQGRLSTEEHAERLDRIWAARTRGELAPIFSDLPGPAASYAGTPVRAARAPRPPRRFRGVPLPLVVLLAVLLVVTVVSHLPLILIGLGVWFLLSRGHCSPRRHHYR